MQLMPRPNRLVLSARTLWPRRPRVSDTSPLRPPNHTRHALVYHRAQHIRSFAVKSLISRKVLDGTAVALLSTSSPRDSGSPKKIAGHTVVLFGSDQIV